VDGILIRLLHEGQRSVFIEVVKSLSFVTGSLLVGVELARVTLCAGVGWPVHDLILVVFRFIALFGWLGKLIFKLTFVRIN